MFSGVSPKYWQRLILARKEVMPMELAIQILGLITSALTLLVTVLKSVAEIRRLRHKRKSRKG
jgi:hypothetical protein